MTRELLSGNNDASKDRIKVLFATMPLEEHVVPMISLAITLKQAGYDVRWYTQERFAAQLAKFEIPHYPFIRPPQFHSDNLTEVFPGRSGITADHKLIRHDLRELMIRRGPEYYEDLKEIHASFPFSMVISDLGFTGIPFINRLMQIPVIALGLHPLKESSVLLPPYGTGETPANSRLSRLRVGIQRFIQENFTHRNLSILQQRMHHPYGIRGTGHVHDDMISHSTIVLQSGSPGFEYTRRDMSDHIRFCGPVLAPPANKEKYWMGHHGTYEHTILVSQDRNDGDPNALIVPVLDAYCNSNARVIAITRGRDTEQLRQRYTCSNVIIEDDIDWDDVMPYADVFVGQGNHQEVLKCIRHKLPMVIAGWRACRKEVGARVAHFTLGQHIRTDRPSRESLSRGIDAVLKDPRYLHHTRTLADEFLQYDPAQMLLRFVQLLSRGYHVAGTPLKVRPIDFTDL
jgi:UDP:flavonoid glycosyltransferase YjiC (YdhE family)